MYDFYAFLISDSHISFVNAVLLCIVFVLGRQRYNGIIEDFKCLQKSTREYEKTFLTYGMKIERED